MGKNEIIEEKPNNRSDILIHLISKTIEPESVGIKSKDILIKFPSDTLIEEFKAGIRTDFTIEDFLKEFYKQTPINEELNGGKLTPLFKILGFLATPLAKIINLAFFKKYPMGFVHKTEDIMIETIDGAKMATDIYFPYKKWKKKEKMPALLIRMPYWKRTLSFVGHLIALNGGACIIQDIRGTGHSKNYGTNSFFLSEREDGIATAKWIHNQEWFNGKLGMWGLSYLGLNQWVVSFDNEHLFKCLTPIQSTPYMFFSTHNGLDPYALSLDIVQIFHEVSNFSEMMTAKRFNKEIIHQILKRMYISPYFALYNDPLDESNYKYHINETFNKTIETDIDLIRNRLGLDISRPDNLRLRKLLEDLLIKRGVNMHSRYLPGILHFEWTKIMQPLYMVASWYDMFAKEMLDTYKEFCLKAPEEIVKKSKMVIGPWVHIDGSMEFIKTMAPIRWFQQYLLRDDLKDNIPPVKFFIMGLNQWFTAEEFKPIFLDNLSSANDGYADIEWNIYNKKDKLINTNLKHVEFLLESGGNANSRNGDGRLVISSNKQYDTTYNEDYDQFCSDPMNPIITCGGNHLHLPKGRFEQSSIEERDDVLVYTSEPFSAPFNVVGEIITEIYASSDCRDTDFIFKLCDVYPDGKSYNLVNRGIRARYFAKQIDLNKNEHNDRNKEIGINSDLNCMYEKKPRAIEPEKIYKYKCSLGYFANTFKKGHKLRLLVYSTDFPYYNINANLAGEKLDPETGLPYKIAHQKIFHNKQFRSKISLISLTFKK